MKNILRTFMINPSIWSEFKDKCKENGSHASVEIRKFINEYLRK